jgi:hypothetical protein
MITVVEMDMWRPFAIGKRKLRRLMLTILQRILVVLVLKDLRSSTGSETQELLVLLHRLVASTSSGVVGSVTQPYALTSSAIASQSSTLGPPSTLSLGTYP